MQVVKLKDEVDLKDLQQYGFKFVNNDEEIAMILRGKQANTFISRREREVYAWNSNVIDVLKKDGLIQDE